MNKNFDKTLYYSVEFLSDWHVGSGLDSGTNADMSVLKDENDLPYLPGKTIKGLLRDAMQDMVEVKKVDQDKLDYIFGKDTGNKTSTSGNAFFSNATIATSEKEKIIKQKLARFLFRNISSTAINANGIAKGKSLRVMEVCQPITLYGEIKIIEETPESLLFDAGKLVRCLGIQRNRGLGRCQITIVKKS